MSTPPKKVAKKKVAKKRAPLALFTALLEANGTEYTGKGKTAIEAVQNIELVGMLVKTKGVLVLKSGKRKSSLLITIPNLRRFLFNELTRVLIGKRMALMLK